MLVVDASVLAPALGDDGSDGDMARGRLHGETISAPELIDLEVASVLQGSCSRGTSINDAQSWRWLTWEPCPFGGCHTDTCSRGAGSYGRT